MANKRVLLSGAAVAGALALMPLGVGSASASPAGPRATFTPHLATANAKSTSFGGWVFSSKTATSVSAEFKQPKISCGAQERGVGPAAAMYTGPSSNEQYVSAEVLTYCYQGKAFYQSAVQISNTAKTGKSVHPGDTVKVTVTRTATKTTATVRDLTSGHTFTLSTSGGGGAPDFQLVYDDSLAANNAQLPVVNFGTMRFIHGTINGKALSSVSSRKAYNMVSSSGTLQIKTSALSSTGKSFTTTWKHA
jgi:hypothetical protein